MFYNNFSIYLPYNLLNRIKDLFDIYTWCLRHVGAVLFLLQAYGKSISYDWAIRVNYTPKNYFFECLSELKIYIHFREEHVMLFLVVLDIHKYIWNLYETWFLKDNFYMLEGKHWFKYGGIWWVSYYTYFYPRYYVKYMINNHVIRTFGT